MKCNAQMAKAKNGASRGRCVSKKGHLGPHKSKTCPHCGNKLCKKNANFSILKEGSGCCINCRRIYSRVVLNIKPRNTQHPSKFHIFPCGCKGVLPKRKKSNKLACRTGAKFHCRVACILNIGQWWAYKRGYLPVPKDMSHILIRKMMSKPCVYCGVKLNWNKLGRGLTPHLDHDHETGTPIGFAHMNCNTFAMKNTIDKLKKEIKRLKVRRGNGDIVCQQ